MDTLTKNRLKFVAGFAVYFGMLWLLWDTPFVYPLKVFVVLLHEISHGLVAVATGGSIQRIVIEANQGGVCQCPGGNAFLTLSAGYLGSMAWGALILAGARAPGSWPRWAAGAIGVAVVVVTLLYVRNLFGVLFGLLFGGILFAASRYFPTEGTRGLLTALGLTSCLYAILDIKSDIIDRPGALSDARMLAQLTGVPTFVWGIVWITIALVAGVWLFIKAYRLVGKAGKRGDTLRA